MARADTVTALSLDRFSQIYGFHPAVFNECYGTIMQLHMKPPKQRIYQYHWQAGRSGREEIATAISHAEALISHVLGWKPLPEFFVSESYHKPTIYHNARLHDESSGKTAIPLQWGQIVTGGVEATEDIALDEALSWSDLDGDGFDETWSIGPLTTNATDVSEIEVHFAADERMGEPLAKKWEIRRVAKTLSGGQVTITGKRWQIVKPAEHARMGIEKLEYIDLNDDTKFSDSVDVIRRYIDNTQAHVTIYWSDGTSQTGYIEPTQHHKAIVHPGTYEDGEWVASNYSYTSEPPRRVDISYQAGFTPTSQGYVQPELALAIARLAVNFLPGDLIEHTSTFNYYWQPVKTEKSYHTIDKELLQNPFGTSLGAVLAWQSVLNMRNRYGR